MIEALVLILIGFALGFGSALLTSPQVYFPPPYIDQLNRLLLSFARERGRKATLRILKRQFKVNCLVDLNPKDYERAFKLFGGKRTKALVRPSPLKQWLNHQKRNNK